MNPFSNLGKFLTNSRQTDNAPPATNPNASGLSRGELSDNSTAYSLLQLPSAHLSGLNALSRCPAVHESYNLPTKRIRHSLENFTEMTNEQQVSPNQNNIGKKLEALIRSHVQLKGSDEENKSHNSGSRKPQNLTASDQQENSVQGKNSDIRNSANTLIANQYMNMYKKEMLSRENNNNNQNPLSTQNDALYTLLANNFNLPGLLPNAMNMNNSPMMELLRQIEAQQTIYQLNQYLQLNQQLHSLQESIKQTNNLRSSNSTETSLPKVHIPPLAAAGSSDRNSSFLKGPCSLSPHFQPEIRSVPQGIPNLKGAFKRSSPSPISLEEPQTSEKSDGTKQKDAEKTEKQYKVEVITLQGHNTRQDQNKEVMLEEEKETKTPTQIEPEVQNYKTERRKNSSQDVLVSKPNFQNGSARDSRKKNRWQMLTEKDEEVASDNVANSSSSNGKTASRTSQRAKNIKKNLDASQGVNWGDLKENRDYNAELRQSKANNTSASHQKSKKKQALTANQKINMKLDLLKSQLEALIQEGGPRQRKLSIMSSLHDPSEVNELSTSINSPANLDIEDKEAEPIYTRVGKNYQPMISDLEINEQNKGQRSPRLLWDPEAIDLESLAAYFEKLQAILGCKVINEEKAIKILTKKNLVQEEVVVTIKKNEKFYSNFLGAPCSDKDVKIKKASDDVK